MSRLKLTDRANGAGTGKSPSKEHQNIRFAAGLSSDASSPSLLQHSWESRLGLMLAFVCNLLHVVMLPQHAGGGILGVLFRSPSIGSR